MATTYLIIAHLLADFILQSNRLVAWKMKKFRGVVVHVCIFAAVSLVTLFPYIANWQTWAVIGAISIFHLVVDQAKINIALRKDAYVAPFVADQALHFLSLLLGGYYLNTLDFNLPNDFFFGYIYGNPCVVGIILALIFLGYVVDVLFFQHNRSRKMNISKVASFVGIYIFYVAAALLML
ncbi:hypothetical protein C0416_04695 [bacterium]|nr:hypothetical protein [bacterium]